MKLTMIERDGTACPAALLSDDMLLDISRAGSAGLLQCDPILSLMDMLDLEGENFACVRALVAATESDEGTIGEQLSAAGAIISAAGVIPTPLLSPRMILCCAMGYKEHGKEMNMGALASNPIGFLKSPGTVSAHRQSVVLPSQEPDQIDFECELACVIGRSFHNVGPDEVMRYVAGYTMVNELGSRRSSGTFAARLNRGGNGQELLAIYLNTVLEKQFPTFCPIGPVLHTADTFGDPHDVDVEMRLNGEVMQSANTSDLVFPIAHTLAYFSRWYRFEPGDILSTGSPSGVGMGRNPPRFLRPGDILETSGSRIGAMVNPVVSA